MILSVEHLDQRVKISSPFARSKYMSSGMSAHGSAD
jgi:hypothetical protein